MTNDQSSNGRLSAAEVDAQLQAMSGADWARALSLARMRAAGLGDGWTGEALLAEILVRLADGTRIWRPGVAPLVTLSMAMWSLANGLRKKSKKGPIDQYATVEVGAGQDDEDDGPPGATAQDDRTPEDIADSKSQLAAIEKRVAGDEDAEMVLMAWSEGLRGKAAAEDLGFDAHRYDAARNRLLRLLAPFAAQRKEK